MDEQRIINGLGDLFRKAANVSIIQYVLCLLRVEGMTCVEGWNEFKEEEKLDDRIKMTIEKFKPISDLDDELLANLAIYYELCSTIEPYMAIANLLRVANKKPYVYTPFGRKFLKKQMLIPLTDDEQRQTRLNVITELVNENKEFEWLTEIFKMIDEKLLDVLSNCKKIEKKNSHIGIANGEIIEVKIDSLNEMVNEIKKLYRNAVMMLQNARLEFKKIADKSFVFDDYSEEFHFLTNDSVGLYGFEIRRPSNPASRFTRTEKGTEAINMMSGKQGEVTFYVGDLDKYKEHPTLHAVKNPGSIKYSPKGEWKPIIYPAKTERIDKILREKNVDEQVEDCLFYILTTGYRVIEFAAKIKVKLADDEINFPNGVNLYLCREKDKINAIGQNYFIYDGWLKLSDDTEATIRKGIDTIALTMNTLSLAFESPVSWTLKYTTRNHSRGYAQPSKDDLELLRKLLQCEGQKYLRSAMEWYTRGQKADEVHAKFICFWIALEGLAQSIYHEQSTIWNIVKDSSETRNSNAKQWFKQYLEAFENCDLLSIFREGYFEFTMPIRKRLESVLKGVFGSQDKVVDYIFKQKEDNLTIWSLRGKLVHHGILSDWGFVDEQIVVKRIGLLDEIAREFILRVALKLQPNEKVPKWKRLFGLAMSGFDPRSCMVTSHERILPTGDWKIKPEWIE